MLTGFLNDLWTLDTQTMQWTWNSGSYVTSFPGTKRNLVGLPFSSHFSLQKKKGATALKALDHLRIFQEHDGHLLMELMQTGFFGCLEDTALIPL
jgi:hypothetical protein